jgi:hypothetical protein
MAAKGMVPVRGHDQVTMLAQLAADTVVEVRNAALATLRGMPENVLHPACEAAVPAGVLELLSEILPNQESTLALLVTNPNAHNTTVERIARSCSEMISERIAINEARLLHAPEIIEALYKNRNTRMSTADRLVEFAARQGLDLTGIPAFKDHVEALRGQLIPEQSDEPLPQDQVFASTLLADSDEDGFEEDIAGVEVVKAQFKPLSMQIAEMSKSEKIRLAMVGNKTARSLLVRDKNRQVAMAAVASPQTAIGEAIDYAKSKDVSEEILRYVAAKKEWIKSAEVKRNLVFNPKCPVGISMRFMSHLRADELRELGRSRGVSAQLRSLAAQMAIRKEKK